MRNVGEHFFWPYERTRRGSMYHRFLEPGVYHYKTRTNRIGTILVKPERKIHSVTLFDETLGNEGYFLRKTFPLYSFLR